MPTDATSRSFIEAVASEMSFGVENAVECWMSQIEEALTDMKLTSLGRLNAVGEILENYKRLTGKSQLDCRRA